MNEIVNDIVETVLPVDSEITSDTEVSPEGIVEASEPTLDMDLDIPNQCATCNGKGRVSDTESCNECLGTGVIK